jgi:hypothetical protein
MLLRAELTNDEEIVDGAPFCSFCVSAIDPWEAIMMYEGLEFETLLALPLSLEIMLLR